MCIFFEIFCILKIENYEHSLRNCLHWVYKIVSSLIRIDYIEWTKLYTLFEKLCILNIQNCLNSLKIVYIKCIYIYIIHSLKKMCTFNVQKFVNSLKSCQLKSYIHYIYIIVYILWKIVYVECTNFCTFIEKLYTLNVKRM